MIKLTDILRKIKEDRVQIRLGRSAERYFGKVQNIIISLDGKDITSENDIPGLGKMNIVINSNKIIVGDIFIPEEYRKQGIATVVYQKISDYFNLPIVNSTDKGFNQTIEGGYIWKDRDSFKPKNLKEYIRKILSEVESNKCPIPTQNIELNLQNRQKAINEYGYGPLNPNEPNEKFWQTKVDMWQLDSIKEAKTSRCGNCAAFDVTTKTLNCIAKGIGDDEGTEDPFDVIKAGKLGYCRMLKFKCASARTCDAWVVGGPITDNKTA